MTDDMRYDVVIVGAGPAGLAAAIRLRQLSIAAGKDMSVCVLEKGSEVGAHILSGAVIEPRALYELIPDWQTKGAPLVTEAKKDRFLFLTKTGAIRLPTPPQMHNKGNYIASLGNLVRWLGKQAEEVGVQIFPGFAAADVMIENGKVVGVKTGEFGRGKDGQQHSGYQPPMPIYGKYTLFAEGCRGSLSERLMKEFGLREGVDPQTYGIGVKELWEIPAEKHQLGLVEHTVGWPMDAGTYGGSFMYHLENNQVAIGVVIGLQKSLSRSVLRVSALQNPSRHSQIFRRRQAVVLRRARDQRRRLSIDPETRIPRRRADRLLGGIRQRAENQRLAHGHEIRHRRGGMCI